jgi:hypothetical protein
MNLCLKGQCKHKNFFPVTEKEIIGAILIIIGSGLSNAGGTGGNLINLFRWGITGSNINFVS